MSNVIRASKTMAERIATQVVENVCELPDYNSPDDQPDLVMCTVKELENCVLRAFEAHGNETCEGASVRGAPGTSMKTALEAFAVLTGKPFDCKATHVTDPPQDCDWPHCGCDPKADKVLQALGEQGILDDAARYRWFKQNPHFSLKWFTSAVHGDLDKAVDDARKPHAQKAFEVCLKAAPQQCIRPGGHDGDCDVVAQSEDV